MRAFKRSEKHVPIGRYAFAFCLLQAFAGAYGVFLVTDLKSALFKADTEIEHGRNAIDAAREVRSQDLHIGFGNDF